MRRYWFLILIVFILVMLDLQGVRSHPGDFLKFLEHDRPILVHHDLLFMSQAPLERWSDDTFQNACEEASMLMVKFFHEGVNIVPAPFVLQQSLLQMVAYEQQHDVYKSMSVYDVQRLFHEVYHVDSSSVIDNPSLDTMKKYLESSVLLVPASGEVLANPNFRRPFPAYHMIVVLGYDDATGEFIVNDPGTKFGKDFRYSYAMVMEAMHDWNGSRETILTGAKRVLAVPLSG